MAKRLFFSLISLMIFIFMFHISASVGFCAEKIDFNNLGKISEYYMDDSAELKFTDILAPDFNKKFIKSENGSLNFGYIDSALWVRFKFDKPLYDESGWYIMVDYAPMDYVTIYIPDGKGGYKSETAGDMLKFSKKKITHKNPVFFLGDNIESGQFFYLRYQSKGTLNAPMKLMKGYEFATDSLELFIMNGVYYGIIIALVVYNLFIFIFLRDNTFLTYVIFITSFALCQGSYNGMAAMFLWPESVTWANYSLVFFANLAFLSLSIFGHTFLHLNETVRLCGKILRGFTVYYLAIMPLIFFLKYRVMSMMVAIPGVLLLIVIFTAAAIAFYRGYKPARYFIIGSTFFFLGFFIILLKILGLIPHTFITEYSVQIGSALEGLILSIALADRINTLRAEKEEAQHMMLVQLEESEKIKTEYLEKSEKLVAERTKELKEANKALENLATTDWLTGLTNKRVFEEVGLKQFYSAKRDSRSISLLMIDVDNFKLYNDTYGHQKGDDCLKRIAKTISEKVQRSSDTVARYGGEEIAVILADTSEKDANGVAERIRQAIQDIGMTHEKSATGVVTVSIGVSCVIPFDEYTFDDLLMQADKALYSAKHKGRNRVEVFR